MHVLLAIHSAPLLDLLRQVITFFPGDEFDILSGKDSTDDTVTFMDPYMIFFAYRAQLRQSMQGDFPEDAKQHVKMLLDFLKAEHRKTPFYVRLPSYDRLPLESRPRICLIIDLASGRGGADREISNSGDRCEVDRD